MPFSTGGPVGSVAQCTWGPPSLARGSRGSTGHLLMATALSEGAPI